MASVRRLIWDPHNVAHIARHDVRPEEVEDVCAGECIAKSAYAGRVMLIDPTRAERMLSVVLDLAVDDAYYVVTARPASRRERRIYSQEKRGSDR